jgi:hemin uptake protein HemP
MKEKMTNPPSGIPSTPSETARNRYDSQTLFHGGQEILIEHAGHAYRLRITRQGKLILTK